MAKIQELCGRCWQGKDWLCVSGSADWELQVLVLELGKVVEVLVSEVLIRTTVKGSYVLFKAHTCDE